MAKLRFSGKEIGLHNLMRVLKSAPEVAIDVRDLHQGNASEVIHFPRPDLSPTAPVSFYKQGDKYLVLTGAHLVPEEGLAFGRLVTKQLVKRIETMDMPALPAQAILDTRPQFEPERQRPPYPRRDDRDPQFANRPRFVNRDNRS